MRDRVNVIESSMSWTGSKAYVVGNADMKWSDQSGSSNDYFCPRTTYSFYSNLDSSYHITYQKAGSITVLRYSFP